MQESQEKKKREDWKESLQHSCPFHISWRQTGDGYNTLIPIKVHHICIIDILFSHHLQSTNGSQIVFSSHFQTHNNIGGTKSSMFWTSKLCLTLTNLIATLYAEGQLQVSDSKGEKSTIEAYWQRRQEDSKDLLFSYYSLQ